MIHTNSLSVYIKLNKCIVYLCISLLGLSSLLYLPISVTRFDKISPLWRNFKVFDKNFFGCIKSSAQLVTLHGQFSLLGTFSQLQMGNILKQPSGHLVTLLVKKLFEPVLDLEFISTFLIPLVLHVQIVLDRSGFRSGIFWRLFRDEILGYPDSVINLTGVLCMVKSRTLLLLL